MTTKAKPRPSPSIFIGPSAWRTFEMMSAASLIQLVPYLGSRGYKFAFSPDWGDADIARSRSKVATKFLESDLEVLFIFDSDIQFKPEDAVRLCEVARDKQSIVGGVFVKRGGEHDPALPLPLGVDVEFVPTAKPIPCDYVSTGFAAVHRKVFEVLAEDMPLLHPDNPSHFYPFYHHNPGYEKFEGSQIWMSEDWALCSNAKAKGFQMWMDPGIRLNHWGIHDYRLEDMVQELPSRRRLDPLPLMIGRHYNEETGKKYHKIVLPQTEEKKDEPAKPKRRSKPKS